MQTVDPDQTPLSGMSNLGLHCLSVSYLWDARHKWVNHLVLADTCTNKKSYFMTFSNIL